MAFDGCAEEMMVSSVVVFFDESDLLLISDGCVKRWFSLTRTSSTDVVDHDHHDKRFSS